VQVTRLRSNAIWTGCRHIRQKTSTSVNQRMDELEREEMRYVIWWGVRGVTSVLIVAIMGVQMFGRAIA